MTPRPRAKPTFLELSKPTLCFKALLKSTTRAISRT